MCLAWLNSLISASSAGKSPCGRCGMPRANAASRYIPAFSRSRSVSLLTHGKFIAAFCISWSLASSAIWLADFTFASFACFSAAARSFGLSGGHSRPPEAKKVCSSGSVHICFACSGRIETSLLNSSASLLATALKSSNGGVRGGGRMACLGVSTGHVAGA